MNAAAVAGQHLARARDYARRHHEGLHGSTPVNTTPLLLAGHRDLLSVTYETEAALDAHTIARCGTTVIVACPAYIAYWLTASARSSADITEASTTPDPGIDAATARVAAAVYTSERDSVLNHIVDALAAARQIAAVAQLEPAAAHATIRS